MPSIDEIVEELVFITGLDLVYDKACFSIECLINEMSSFLVKKDFVYKASAISPEFDFLLANLLYVLKKSGGMFNLTLPVWVGKKWNYIKDKFDQDGFHLHLIENNEE